MFQGQPFYQLCVFPPSLACPQQMPLFLKASKTDAFCQGHMLVAARSTALVCAVTAMHDYFLTACTRRPLFTFNRVVCSPGRQLLTFPRHGARHASLPFKTLKGHSLGNGAASSTAAMGLPNWLIKVLSRWSSDCYQVYICTPRNVLLSAALQMASVSSF